MIAENSSVVEDDTDDDFDWEEVEAPPQQVAQPLNDLSAHEDVEEGPSERPNIEITIQVAKKKGPAAGKKNAKAVQLHAERLVRVDCHKIHTVGLLANARIRNKWINDPLLHARLMSLTPLELQNAFALIHKSRVPEAPMRGRLFEAAITRLAEWWSNFFQVEPEGHIRSRTFDEVQRALAAADPKGKGKARARDVDEDGGEVVRSEKSLMKHALMRRGSRDTSAQLFTALCRALGIPARLVVSLQSVPWQAGVGKPKPSTKKAKKKGDESAGGSASAKGKEKAVEAEGEDEDEDEDMEEVVIPSASSPRVNGKGKEKEVFPGSGQRLDGSSTPLNGKDKGKQKAPPVIRLRRNKGQKLGTTAPEQPKPRERTPDPTTTAPVFWTEVFSRADARWIPVDPIRCIVNKRKAFDPTPNPNATVKPDRKRPVKVENRMVYVVAFEEDGYGRDVTPRYAREYGAKVAKVQQGGKGRQEWWERILKLVERPYRLQRDDLEDEELQFHQLTEGMPTSVAGFKNHPLYVLARHLKRDQIVEPLVELGKFRGEPVYPRSSVISLKTAENWMRQGRNVREGCQPLKWVKQHAVTVNKKRAIEMAMADRKHKGLDNQAIEEGLGNEGGVMQGLYAEHQTELYKPDPVIDGRVPKNDFGNIDLYVPTMLPAGAVHIPYKGTAKIARQLGFDFAEAVTGFEFKKRRAFPVISGVVVAAENEEALLEAYWEAERDAEAKRRAKRQEQVIKRWTKLVQGLRIRQRLQEQYADSGVRKGGESIAAEGTAEEEQMPGGFLTGADDVVQPFTLPRNLHEVPKASTGKLLLVDSSAGSSVDVTENEFMETQRSTPQLGVEDEEEDDMEEIIPVQLNGAPKTMRELAEDAARHQQIEDNIEKFDDLKTSVALSEAEKVSVKTTRSATRTPQSNTETPAASTKPRIRLETRQARKRSRKKSEDSLRDQESESVASSRPSPSKRARASAVPVAASTRVLRTRIPKSASKIQEEKEMEQAYRRAILD